MNYQEHKKKLLSSLSFARKWLKDGEVQKAIDFFSEWWYEYEMARCDSPAPGDCYMDQNGFDEFLDGFNDLCEEDLIAIVCSRVARLRIDDEADKFHRERVFGIDQDQKPKDNNQGKLF